MVNADYVDDQALLTNTPDQTESLLHNLEQTAGDIVLFVNTSKIKVMCMKY